MTETQNKHIILRSMASLPLGALYILSDICYVLLYYAARYRRKVVRRNLLQSFPGKTEKELVRIEKAYYHHMCDLGMEILKTLSISDHELRQRVEICNTALPESIARGGENIFLMTGHMGNWEWCQEICRRYKEPSITCEIYKQIHNAYFSSLMKTVRGRWDTVQIEMHDTVRAMLRMSKGEESFLCGFICDQRPESFARHFLTFMNQKTGFQPGAEEIARKIGARLLYLDVEKPARGHYRFTFREIAADEESMQYPMTHRFYEMLEESIRRQPEIWLWSHNRWNHPRNIGHE